MSGLTTEDMDNAHAVLRAMVPYLRDAIADGINKSDLVQNLLAAQTVSGPTNFEFIDFDPMSLKIEAKQVEKPSGSYVKGEEKVWAQVYAAVIGNIEPDSPTANAQIANFAADLAVERYRQRYQNLVE